MECLRETNFFEARAVRKGKFLYFLDLRVRNSVAIPVELRQPTANSLAVGCDGSSLGEGLSCRVNSARLMQPLKR